MGVTSIKPEGVQPETAGGSGGTQYEDLGEGALSGNLTRDPELSYTPNGRAIVSLRVADTPRVKDEATGQWVDGTTEFWDVIGFAGLAERAAEWLRKGDRICAVGKWQRQRWTNKEGEAQEAVKLSARDIGPSLLFTEVKVNRQRKGQRS